MYTCKYFRIEELVPRDVFNVRGNASWELLDEKILITIDRLRKRYGPMTINNWVWGGDRMWSGLRTSDSPYYSRFSQHSFGRAVDVLFKNITAEEVRQDILNNKNDEAFEYINSFESNVSWLHIDVRNCTRVKVYSP